jgi:hypothetical protein
VSPPRFVVLIALLAAVALGAGGCSGTSTSSTSISTLAGPSLEQFGLRERCERGGGDCTERAMEAVRAALGRLGPEVRDPPITNTAGALPPDRLYVHVTSEPQLAWRSSTGAEGTGGGIVIDLTDDENPYALVAPRLAFELSDEDAAAIRDALFVDR